MKQGKRDARRVLVADVTRHPQLEAEVKAAAESEDISVSQWMRKAAREKLEPTQ